MGVDVSGLDETLAAFAAYNAVLDQEEHHALDEAGRLVRDRAKANAAAQGLDGAGKYSHSRDRHPGGLIHKLSYRVFTSSATVREYSTSTNHSPRYVRYPYPRRYEYGDRHRPFMEPALEESRADVDEIFRQMLDQTRDRVGLE